MQFNVTTIVYGVLPIVQAVNTVYLCVICEWNSRPTVGHILEMLSSLCMYQVALFADYCQDNSVW